MNYKKKYNKYKKKYLNLKYNGGNTLDKTLTQKFIKRKDIFNQNEKEECLKSVKYTEEYVTNKKFSKFNQLYYHAGDYDDLNEYAIKPINDFYKNKKDKKIDMKNNLFKDLKVNYFEKYSNSKDNIKNTLFFYFEKYKKANIIVIQNNELKVFLPFNQ